MRPVAAISFAYLSLFKSACLENSIWRSVFLVRAVFFPHHHLSLMCVYVMMMIFFFAFVIWRVFVGYFFSPLLVFDFFPFLNRVRDEKTAAIAESRIWIRCQCVYDFTRCFMFCLGFLMSRHTASTRLTHWPQFLHNRF